MSSASLSLCFFSSLYCSLFLHSIGNFHVFFFLFRVYNLRYGFFFCWFNFFLCLFRSMCFFFICCFVCDVFLFSSTNFFLHGKSLFFFSSHIHNHFSSRHWNMMKQKRKTSKIAMESVSIPLHYFHMIFILFLSMCIVCYFLSTPFSLDIDNDDDDDDERWR